jgi:hypothetical protein
MDAHGRQCQAVSFKDCGAYEAFTLAGKEEGNVVIQATRGFVIDAAFSAHEPERSNYLCPIFDLVTWMTETTEGATDADMDEKLEWAVQCLCKFDDLNNHDCMFCCVVGAKQQTITHGAAQTENAG